jgi:hypothetical protein
MNCLTGSLFSDVAERSKERVIENSGLRELAGNSDWNKNDRKVEGKERFLLPHHQ